MRHDPSLDYLPMRLSLVPRLFDTSRPVDAVLIHTSVPRGGNVSLGIEDQHFFLQPLSERTRAHGGLVIAPAEPEHAIHVRRSSEVPVDWIDFAVKRGG